MTFLEALRESFNGQWVVSCTDSIYSVHCLNVKKLSETAYVSDAITSDKERKGRWKVFTEY